MFKATGLVATAIAAILAASSVSAGQYFKGQIGQVKSTVGEDTCEFIEEFGNALSVNSRCDDTDTGLRLAYGYGFNPYFAVEGGYSDFGATEAEIFYNSNFFKIALEMTGFDVSAVGRLQVTDGVVFVGRAGALAWDAEVNQKASGGGSDSDRTSGTSLLLGIGAEIALFDAGSLTIDFDYAKDVGDEDEFGKGKLNRFSAGFRFLF